MNSGQPLAAGASRKSRAKLIIIFLAVLLGISLIGVVWYLKSGMERLGNNNGRTYTEAQVKNIRTCKKYLAPCLNYYDKASDELDIFNNVDIGGIDKSKLKKLAGIKLIGQTNPPEGNYTKYILLEPGTNGEENFVNILRKVILNNARDEFRETARYKAKSGFEYIEYRVKGVSEAGTEALLFAQIDNLAFISTVFIPQDKYSEKYLAMGKETFEYRVERFVKEVQKR